MSEEYLTLKEVCQLMKIHYRTLRRLRQSGLLRDIYPRGRPGPGDPKTGQMIRIMRSEVDSLMANGMKEPRQK